MAERDYVVLEFIGHSRKVGVQATAVTQQVGHVCVCVCVRAHALVVN